MPVCVEHLHQRRHSFLTAPKAECSGRGTCDYETGRCMCDSLFEGVCLVGVRVREGGAHV